MNKEELLQELSNKINTGEISQDEVFGQFNLVTPTATQVDNEKIKRSHHFSITKMLYALGAAVVIIGIIIFFAQIWDDLGSLGRIVVTLGLGLLIAAIGSMLLKQKPEDNIGAVFHFIGGVLIPSGVLITLHELGVSFASLWPAAIAFGVIFVFYLLLNLAHGHSILKLFAIANGTVFMYLLVGAMIKGPNYYIYHELYEDLYAYLTMMIGASYLFLAQFFCDKWNKRLLGALCFFGSGGFLVAAFSQVLNSPLWQIFYFLILSGGLFLSIYMKSRSILFMSTIFLVAHITRITSEYFADSIGWPISLVILGFVFIGLGYASVTINKKYIRDNN